jgi:hypothetical protein
LPIVTDGLFVLMTSIMGEAAVLFAVLFVIVLSTRRVKVAGIAAALDAAWMSQMSRNVTDVDDGCLRGSAI